jgi:predicted Fe-S protein YdhL (DUF1289 family)
LLGIDRGAPPHHSSGASGKRVAALAKYPSPCIDVCKYKLKGHCIGCAMTKKQKKQYKKIDGKKKQVAFLGALRDQQIALGDRFKGWRGAYARKCDRKGVAWPL